MASTHSATLSFDESPHGIVGRSLRVDLQEREIGRRIEADHLRWNLAFVGQRDGHVELLDAHPSRLADDHVIVGEDVAVAADDDARAETVLDAATRSEEVIRVAEEGEEGVARHLTPDDLLRRDVDDRGDRPFGDAAEVGEIAGGPDRSRRADGRPGGAGRLCAGLGRVAKPACHEQTGGKARDQNECGRESSLHDNFRTAR